MECPHCKASTALPNKFMIIIRNFLIFQNPISRALLDKLLGESSRTTSRSTTVAESVISSLSTPHHLAIDQGDYTPSEERDSEVTPSTPGTISALSDVTLTSTDVDTPRTLTSASSLGTY